MTVSSAISAFFTKRSGGFAESASSTRIPSAKECTNAFEAAYVAWYGPGAFAASGTCLVTSGHRDAYLASGGPVARVFHSADRGRTWSVTDAAIPPADAGGVFSLSFRNPERGIAVGGDFTEPSVGTDASATTVNRGRTWVGGGDLSGYRSGVDHVEGLRATAAPHPPSLALRHPALRGKGVQRVRLGKGVCPRASDTSVRFLSFDF